MKSVMAVLAVVVVLSACSSSSGSKASSGSTGSVGSSTASGSTWVIGNISTFSGPLSSTFASTKGVLGAWQDWVNATGGINGHKVKVISMDDQNSFQIGLSDAQTLVEGDHVLAFVSNMGNTSAGWRKYVDSVGVPVIGAQVGEQFGFQNAQQNIDDPLYYPAGTQGAVSRNNVAEAAKQMGATKIGVVYCVETPSCATALTSTKAQAESVGLPFGKGVAVSGTAANYTAPCLAMKASGTDAVSVALATTTAAAVVQSCAEQGYHPYILGVSGEVTAAYATDPNFAKAGGTVDAFPWWDNSLPGVKQYNDVMSKYYPAYSQLPSASQEVWTGLMIFEQGAKLGKLGDNPTSAQLTAGLNMFSNETLGGILPNITYANGNRNVPCSWLFNIVDSKFHTLNNGKLYCPAGS
jgi:branched-chain amino acid transport system substrate-binding protein